MSDLALGLDADLLVDKHRIPLVVGNEAIAQCWRSRLRLFAGEWFLDQRLGVPYQDWAQGVPRPVIRAKLVKLTVETAGISTVRDVVFEFEAVTRLLKVQIDAVFADDRFVRLAFNEALL